MNDIISPKDEKHDQLSSPFCTTCGATNSLIPTNTQAVAQSLLLALPKEELVEPCEL